MPSVCTGVAEMTPDQNTLARNPPISQKKLNVIMTMSVKEIIGVLGMIIERPFLYHIGERDS